MNDADNDPSADRRTEIVGRLVRHYQAAPEPEKWLQSMTLQALRALDRADLSPSEKSPARREIHAIHREVAVKAKALRLSRSLAVITKERSEEGGGPGPGPARSPKTDS